jgi:hypothetical protein
VLDTKCVIARLNSGKTELGHKYTGDSFNPITAIIVRYKETKIQVVIITFPNHY